MAASIQASRLLALPLELRISIYKQLLNPDPDRVHTLYDDQFGTEIPLPIHATILRVNKQIYSEAVSILYDTATLEVYLGTPVIGQCSYRDLSSNPDGPPNLFRTDSDGNFNSKNRIKWCRSGKFEGEFVPLPPGYIYPHCFQRLRKVRLVTSHQAMWEMVWRDEGFGSCFSRTGHLVLRILRLLAQMQVTKSLKTMRFKFAMQTSGRTAESQPLMENGEEDQKTKTIVGLLKALQRRTNAEIEIEEVEKRAIRKRLKEWKMGDWKMEDAEVDEWEKILLN